MKNKSLLKLIIIIAIAICIFCSYEVYQYIRKNEVVDGIRTQQDIDMLQDQVEEYLSDKIAPKGIAKLYGKYKGDNDLNDIYRSIYSFVNYLTKLSKKVKYDNNDAIISYYESNRTEIKMKTGITRQNDFIELIEYLNNVGYHGEKLIDCEIDSSTFNTGKKYFSFELKFNFEGNDNDFKLKLNFANSKNAPILVYYSVIKDTVD